VDGSITNTLKRGKGSLTLPQYNAEGFELLIQVKEK
jgi:hypothetical protein